MRARIRKVTVYSALVATVGLVAFDRFGEPALGFFDLKDDAKASAARKDVAKAQQSPESPGKPALPGRQQLGEPRGELFGSLSWQPPPAKVEPPAPVAPPMRYAFGGKLLREGQAEYFLSRDGNAIPVKEGDVLDGGYRVESLGDTGITLIYPPLKHKAFIPVVSSLPAGESSPEPVAQATAPREVASSLPVSPTPARPSAPAKPPVAQGTVSQQASVPPASPPAPIPTSSVVARGPSHAAQLAWDGPRQVRMGAPFSVALRVTASQPVASSPMQLRFDPSVLQTVSVKPGQFFASAERNFRYNVEDGSIYVGATQAGSGAPANAEFVVVTFKPLKTVPVAELSIASVSLQGSAGEAIGFAPFASFKTAVHP